MRWKPWPIPALATRLAYIVTGDAAGGCGVQGRAGGSVGIREPPDRGGAGGAGRRRRPGKTDLSFYPLLYWPITADAQPLTADQSAALNKFMSNGGIILIDTRDSGSGAGFAPGTDAALRRVAKGLVIPPLAPLTTDHVLARSFYLLHDFPGRYTGGDGVGAARSRTAPTTASARW